MFTTNGKKLIQILEAFSSTYLSKKEENVEEKNSIKIVASNGAIQFVSTNENVHVAYKLKENAVIEKDFSSTFDNSSLPKMLSTVIGNSSNEISLKKEENKIVACGVGTIILEEIQNKTSSFRKLSDEFFVSILAGDLLKAIKSISLSASTSDKTSIMNNVLLQFNKEESTFKLTGFNGQLMCVYNIPLEDIDSEKNTYECLINAKSLSSITKCLDIIKEEIININFFSTEKGNYLSIVSEDMKISIPLDLSKFVQCQSLLNENYENSVIINAKKINNAIKTMFKIEKIKFNFKKEENSLKLFTDKFSNNLEIVSGIGDIDCAITISTFKSLINEIEGSNIKFYYSKKGLIKITEEDSDEKIFIMGCCKKEG